MIDTIEQIFSGVKADGVCHCPDPAYTMDYAKCLKCNGRIEVVPIIKKKRVKK